jgi:hypothetical protein
MKQDCKGQLGMNTGGLMGTLRANQYLDQEHK